MRILSSIKQAVVPAGIKPRQIQGGLCKSLWMNVDFKEQTQAWCGVYERELLPWMRKFSKDIVSAADLGTAEGYYSIFFMGKTKARKVFSFDPGEKAAADFKENMRLNQWPLGERIQFFSKLVGKENNAKICTLDSLLPSLEEPCLIKMDVEGAEGDVLTGAARLLARSKTRWMIEVHSKPLEDEILSRLQKAGYSTAVIPNAWWRCILPEKRFGHNRWVAAAKDIPIS